MLKRIFLVLVVCMLVVTGFFAFFLHRMIVHHNTSISIRESDDSYEFYASYTNNKTGQVQKYLDDKLNTNKMFRNGRIDAMITLTDNTNVYIKTTPGRLLIKLDKNENTFASYARIKRVGEELRMKFGEE